MKRILLPILEFKFNKLPLKINIAVPSTQDKLLIQREDDVYNCGFFLPSNLY
jgi:hypothetical protein